MADGPGLRPRQQRPYLLASLARELGLELHGEDVAVSGLALHTSAVEKGDLFVAIQGVNRHGIELWEEALSVGAGAILTDVVGAAVVSDQRVPVLVAPDPRAILGAVAARIYGTSGESHPPVFSVTGTNGKTSTAFLLEASMRGLGWKTALSTTAERRVNGVAYSSTLTTPEAPDTHAMLACATEAEVSGVAMEVSAQALSKNRLQGVMSAVAGFTNLSHDHLEDFGDMDTYLAAKAALFGTDMAHHCVICVDSTWGDTLASRVKIPVTTFAKAGHSGASWHYDLVEQQELSTWWSITSPVGKTMILHAPIVGEHMVSNATLAILMLIEFGVNMDAISEAMGSGTDGIPVAIPGRIERVSGEHGPKVFVDAGRSADAYEHTLTTIRAFTTGRIVMVCGTSGNRDATKRPIMGATAARLADVVIVTDDDPRREDPATIRAGLLEGARLIPGAQVLEIPDPSVAIRYAINLVAPGDSVLWSGPGSQSYRDIMGEKIPYSARQEARVALADAGWPVPEKGFGL
jgi:UDP-N-acetylmuramoyl-L-alanyl-D-glutamate--2,6-diaminopimelate ligase